MLRRTIVILCLVAMTALLAQAVLAVSWGPSTSYYAGKARVTGWGTFWNDGYVYAKNRIYVRDDMPNDGNNVYGTTAFQFYKCVLMIGLDLAWYEVCTWESWSALPTPEWAGGTHSYTHSFPLPGNGSQAKAATRACAQMGWPVPDSCAPTAYPKFSY